LREPISEARNTLCFRSEFRMRGGSDSPAPGLREFAHRFLSAGLLSIFLSPIVLIGTSSAEDSGVLKAIEREISSTFEEVSPSVFKVYALVPIHDGTGRRVWGRNVGSGVAFDSTGHLMTTGDVVFGARDIEVISGAGLRCGAKLIGIDPETNIAVLKIDGGPIRPVRIGDSDQVKAGHWAIVLGNTFDVMSPFFGTVMGRLGKNGWIQVNVRSYPGNSGAPVFDSSGRMVGIVTAALAEPPVSDLQLASSGGSLAPSSPISGVTLVLPVNFAMEAAKRIIEGKRGWIGLKIYSKPMLIGGKLGFRIIDVIEGSPAERAGVRGGDIIISCQRRRFKDVRGLVKFIKGVPAGERIELELIRESRRFRTYVEVGELPGDLR